jgi:hypothetical protein
MLTLQMIFPTAEARERSAKTYKVIEGGNETLDRLRETFGKVCRLLTLITTYRICQGGERR